MDIEKDVVICLWGKVLELYEAAPFGITVDGICRGSNAMPLRESHTIEEDRKYRDRNHPPGEGGATRGSGQYRQVPDLR